MHSRSFRSRVVLIAFAFLVFCTFLAYLFMWDNPARLLNRPMLINGHTRVSSTGSQVLDLPSLSPLPSESFAHTLTLGVASQVFVLSLPRRIDRRMTMDAISHALGFMFVYVDGVEATDVRVDQALRVLTTERHTFWQNSSGKSVVPNAHVPEYVAGRGRGDAEDSDSMGSVNNSLSFTSVDTSSAPASDGVFEYGEMLDLPCATPEDPFPTPINAVERDLLPPWRILSRGMVACWIGHLNIIRQTLRLQLEVVIVLEDDVDLEYDISQRLLDMWPALPREGWDIVMLGHCHSNESIHPPLLGAASLRPSYAPKCTHAYAISHSGAKRLARLLSAPGFAYSRAVDQAISWLINTGKIRSYSVVPAIVVQSKRTVSDIWRSLPRTKQLDRDDSDKGSKWRDVLMDSTLERLGVMAGMRFT